MKQSELKRIIKEEIRKVLNEGAFYASYNRGRGQGKALVKSEESDYTQPRVFASYEEAKKYVDLANDLQKNSPGGGAVYWVSDKDMNMIKQ